MTLLPLAEELIVSALVALYVDLRQIEEGNVLVNCRSTDVAIAGKL